MEQKGHKDTYGWIKGRMGSRIPRSMVIYIVTEEFSTAPCKIGSAADISRRICSLNSGNPRRLVLRANLSIPWSVDESWLNYQKRVRELELESHAKLASSRMRGEWFQAHWMDARFVVEGCISRTVVQGT